MAQRQGGAGIGLLAAGAVFLLSVALIGFGYGFAAARWKLFPHDVIAEAIEAAKALLRLEEDSLMQGLERLDPAAPPAPVATTLSPEAGGERLLIVGGPYQMMDRCPTWGCLAWVTDRAGKVLHAWEVDLGRLLEGMEGFSGTLLDQNVYPVGAALGPDGMLVLTFHARNLFPYQVGIAKIAGDGRIVWKRFDHAHHWFGLDAEGRIHAPSMERRTDIAHAGPSAVDLTCRAGTMYHEGVRIYAPDGTVLRDVWLMDGIVRSGWPGLFYGLRDGCDPLHVNSVEVVSPAVAARLPGVAAGDLLVSVREASAIAIVDPVGGRVRHLAAGIVAAQHAPRFLPDGSVVIFDNLGGERAEGGSRILQVNLVTGERRVVFPRRPDGPGTPFFAIDGGHIDVSPDGRRIMVSPKDMAVMLEIDVATGAVLWTLEKAFDISAYLARRGLPAEVTRARFKVYGAHYLPGDAVIR